MESRTFHAGHEFDQAGVTDIKDEAVDDLVAEVAMGHLAALEAERRLYFIPITEKANRLVFLCLIVMLVDGDGELDLFDDDNFLLLASRAVALVLLIEELAVILDLAHRGYGVRRDFYKIQGSFASHFESVKGRHNAELLAVLVDDADFAGADTFVGADE